MPNMPKLLLSTLLVVVLLPVSGAAQAAASAGQDASSASQAAPPAGSPAAPSAAPAQGRPAFRPFQMPKLDPLLNTQPPVTDDWLTFSHDPQRTGWNNGETTLSPSNASDLKLLWSTQLPLTPSPFAGQTLTAPVVASGIQTADGVKTVAYTMSGDSTLYAIDADTGKIIWQKAFPDADAPVHDANWMCTDTEQATPVIDKDKGIIYFTTIDGNLRAASLADGSPKLTPTIIAPPYVRNWSLNLVDNVIYTSMARGCGGNEAHGMVSGNVVAADVHDPDHITINHVYTGASRPAGPWNRGGPILGPEGVYVQTADGRYDPASGYFAESVVAIRLGGQGIDDSYTPANWRYMNAHDLDLGAGSPILFVFHGQPLIATGAKEAIEYLLDANELGGFDHNTPLYASPKLGNDPDMLEQYGIWGGGATWQNANGDRYLYIPMWNAPAKNAPAFPHTNGDVSQGSIMAFQVIENDDKYSLQPAWISGVNQAPDSPAVANGVVFAVGTGEQTMQNPGHKIIRDRYEAAKLRNTPVGHQILYAFDAETGKQLFSSQDTLTSWDHFSQPVIAHGEVFVVSYDGHVSAFGLK
jgi:outer membrane protein assembly factor BamB